eukprot:scaffold215537_cov31-Tisochrysis_lutea.AAC.2
MNRPAKAKTEAHPNGFVWNAMDVFLGHAAEVGVSVSVQTASRSCLERLVAGQLNAGSPTPGRVVTPCRLKISRRSVGQRLRAIRGPPCWYPSDQSAHCRFERQPARVRGADALAATIEVDSAAFDALDEKSEREEIHTHVTPRSLWMRWTREAVEFHSSPSSAAAASFSASSSVE